MSKQWGVIVPRENREIFFSEHELKIALMQFSARKGLRFKAENITDFSVSTKDEIFMPMKVFDAEKNRTGLVKYTNPEIAAALMGYCMYLKIPLQKQVKNLFKLKGKSFI
jgi:adenylate cyclase